jgi:hypothetical protein
MKSHHLLGWVLGFTAFVVNPAIGCSSSPDEFNFGEAEMIAAVEGAWQVTFAHSAGTSTFAITVERGPAPGGPLSAPPGRTPQCGTRTFTRPAAACFPTSELALKVNVLDGNPPTDVTDGSGWYRIYNTRYVGGQMLLTFGSDLTVEVRLDPNDAVRESFVTWQGARVNANVARLSTP